ncbi:MAG: hypothetical protein ABIS36_06515 [Chryseolinea sp.]
MNKNNPHSKKLVEYLDGNLSADEIEEFEKTINEDGDLKKELVLTGRVIDAIEGHAFKQMLMKIHDQHFGSTGDQGKHSEPS